MIREQMKKRGFTQKQIEEMTGIAQSSVSRIANGKQKPTYRQAVLLKKVLGIPLGFWEEGDWLKSNMGDIKV